jgi:predicted transcriptional regulator
MKRDELARRNGSAVEKMNVLEEEFRTSIRESLKKRFKERRGNVEIIADVLFVARYGATKTEIVHKANLNFTRLKSYLDYLEGKGFLENSGPFYSSTEKGKNFLREYQLVKGILT